jgi:hypothetical protein
VAAALGQPLRGHEDGASLPGQEALF